MKASFSRSLSLILTSRYTECAASVEQMPASPNESIDLVILEIGYETRKVMGLFHDIRHKTERSRSFSARRVYGQLIPLLLARWLPLNAYCWSLSLRTVLPLAELVLVYYARGERYYRLVQRDFVELYCAENIIPHDRKLHHEFQEIETVFIVFLG